MTNYGAALFAVALAAVTSRSGAFTAPISCPPRTRIFLLSSSKTETDGAVSTASTAAAAEEDPKDVIPDFSSSTKPMDESSIFSDDGHEDAVTSWHENLEALLAPDTAVAKRQIVLSDLLNAAPEIQESVRTALKERKVSDQ